MEKQKKVTFKPQYTVLKWTHGEKCEKSLRTNEIPQGDTIEQELIIQHEDEFKNKKEICSDRIRDRDKLMQGISNPYMINNNYLDDLLNQDTYLRPQNSNMKNSENNYLKMPLNN